MIPEVLAPVGDLERLHSALQFGADAVYLGGQQFGMRANPANFDAEGLCHAVALAHAKGIKVYVTCNTLPRSEELAFFPQYLSEVVNAKVDAMIVADIGLFSMIRRLAPQMPIHISTQTGIVNYATANALYDMGASRVVLARELSLEEIYTIRKNIPPELELEVFVHGAMCVSFSGRCLLSAYFTNRDANRGACSQPCRWKYALMEEKREGMYMPIEEEDGGTYILNAEDLCMIDHIDKLVDVGVSSLKIEGRAKSAYYVSVITNAYRMAVDHYRQNPNHFTLPSWIRDEVFKVSHRKYCTGFFFGRENAVQFYETGGYIRSCDVVGIVKECRDGVVYASQRNRFFSGDRVEILEAGKPPHTLTLDTIYNAEGERIQSVNHAMMDFSFPCAICFASNSIIRKPIEKLADKVIH